MKIRSFIASVLVAGSVLTPAVGFAAESVSFSQPNISVSVGATNVTTVYGGSDFYVSSNTNPTIMTYTLVGPTMTINGKESGSAVVSVCNMSGNCSSLNVTVSGSSTTTNNSTNTTTNTNTNNNSLVSMSATNSSLTVGQATTVSVYGSTSYFISVNSNSEVVNASLNGNILNLTGLKAGSASVTVCGTSGGCSTIAVTVTAPAGTVTPIPTITPTPIVAGVSTADTSALLLATIQTMQAQLAQLLKVIETMQTQLSQLAASVKPVGSVAGVSTVSSANFRFTSFLELESTGSEVTALQQKLTEEGYYSGPITGKFGPLTEAAVKKYQIAKGIEPAGYVGPGTRAALNGE